MFGKNQQVGNYTIKRILPADGVIEKYLSEDPFFHSPVTLNVIDIRSLSPEQKHNVFSKFQKLFLLEHEAVSPVYDSGFEADYVFFTNARDQKKSLLERLQEGISPTESLHILKTIVEALQLAAENRLTHGPLTEDQIYFCKENQPTIENFGINHYYSNIRDNTHTDYPLSNILVDIDNILLKIRKSYEFLENLDEKDKIIIDNLEIFSKKLRGENNNPFKNYDELLDVISAIIDSKSVKDRSLDNISERGFNLQKREEVLPFIRSIIEERNNLKVNLVEEKNINDSLKEKVENYKKRVENLGHEKYDSEITKSKYYKKITYFSMVVSFVFGVLFTWFYNYSFNNHGNGESHIAVSDIKIADTQGKDAHSVVISNDKKVEKERLEKETGVKSTASMMPEMTNNVFASELPIGADPVAEVQKTSPLDDSEQWLPAGGEFSEQTELKKTDIIKKNALDEAEEEVLFNQLLYWAAAWEKQDVDSYFSFYGANFSPGGGRSLAEWKKMRMTRLLKPDWIKVAVQDIRMEKISAEEVQVKFQQDYMSNSFQDRTQKILNLAKQEGGWVIISERSLNL